MEKTTTLNLRVNPEVKKNAEEVLSALGLSMTAAINIYLKQIAFRGAIPFDIALPKAPDQINADTMSAKELKAAIQKGLDDINNGNTVAASEFFENFRRTHTNG